MTEASIFLVLAELNIIIKEGDAELSHRDARGMAVEYVKAHYPDEDWRYLGLEMQNSGKCRLVFQRTDLAPDDNFWVLGEGFTAPWVVEGEEEQKQPLDTDPQSVVE